LRAIKENMLRKSPRSCVRLSLFLRARARLDARPFARTFAFLV
jgi:hypothetical protein